MTDEQVKRAAEVVMQFAAQRFPNMGFVIVPFGVIGDKESIAVSVKCNRNYEACVLVADAASRILAGKVQAEREGNQL